ncbi:FecR family protein [Sphingobacterium anhuiense]|uniref:FecR family protein n=1 Tax=Sphingobacterium anhuiense TaxID=493780 RepID=UPI003C2BC8BA
MNKRKRQYLTKLAEKIQQGSITDEETIFFDKWYNGLSKKELNIDSQYAKNKNQLKRRIFRRIQNDIKSTEKVPAFFHWKKLAIAASLVLGTILGSLYFYLHDDHSINDPQPIIVAGKNNAILTLADGSKINLSEAANGLISHTANVDIIKTSSGSIQYKSQTSSSNKPTAYNTIEAPAGGKWSLTLPDGTQVWLNSSSSITYPTQFSATERKVKIKGEAFFDVAHNKKAPFIVSSGQQLIRVLGTEFNVEAYEEDAVAKTTLLKGAVAIESGNKTVKLVPGEQAKWNGKEIVKEVVDTEAAIAWKEGYFKFNENIESILTKISRWYNVEIIYLSKPDPATTFSGKIARDRNLNSVLKMLEYDGNIHFQIQGRRVIVKK